MGLLCPWNTATIDDHLMTYYNNEGKYIKAGSCLGMGICSAGINDDNGIAFAFLSDSMGETNEEIIRECAILGIGMATAGRSSEELQ